MTAPTINPTPEEQEALLTQDDVTTKAETLPTLPKQTQADAVPSHVNAPVQSTENAVTEVTPEQTKSNYREAFLQTEVRTPNAAPKQIRTYVRASKEVKRIKHTPQGTTTAEFSEDIKDKEDNEDKKE